MHHSSPFHPRVCATLQLGAFAMLTGFFTLKRLTRWIHNRGGFLKLHTGPSRMVSRIANARIYRAVRLTFLQRESLSKSLPGQTQLCFQVPCQMTIWPWSPRTQTITGTTMSILANRLSWYFDLKGPSIQLDTACSSSMTAMDLACKSLQDSQTSMV
jgi:hypothetical protein